MNKINCKLRFINICGKDVQILVMKFNISLTLIYTCTNTCSKRSKCFVANRICHVGTLRQLAIKDIGRSLPKASTCSTLFVGHHWPYDTSGRADKLEPF